MAGIWKKDKPHRLMKSLFSVFLVLGIFTCNGIGAEAEEWPYQSTFNVSYRVLDFKYKKDKQEKTLNVAVWYPTAAEPSPHNYGGATNGKSAIDGAPLADKGPYPMLVFSHGYGGGGLGAVFFTERLASCGWIVAAPDHRDEHSAVRIRADQVKDFNRWDFWQYVKEIVASGPEDRDKYLYRLDEMRLVIDRLAASEDFREIIDSSKVAVGGHSFGGYTALGICGTIEEHYDPRVKAILLFSTGAGGYLFREAELAAVRIPSMLFIGERERDHLRGSKTMSEIAGTIYKNMAPPKYFLEIKGANHFSFNNRFADNRRKRLLSGNEEQFEVIRRYSIAFLEKYVAGKKHFDHVLENSDRMLTHYTRE